MRALCFGFLVVGLIACGNPAVTPTLAVNPTVRAQLTATRQREAELGEAACRTLDAEFARFGATFQRGQDPQTTLLDYSRVSGLNPNAHTPLSDQYTSYILNLAKACQKA